MHCTLIFFLPWFSQKKKKIVAIQPISCKCADGRRASPVITAAYFVML